MPQEINPDLHESSPMHTKWKDVAPLAEIVQSVQADLPEMDN